MKFARKIASPWATSVSWWHELTVREISSSYSASYPFQIVTMLVTKKFHYMTFVAIGDNAMPVHVFCTLCSSESWDRISRFSPDKEGRGGTWNQCTLSYSFFLMSSHTAAGVFFLHCQCVIRFCSAHTRYGFIRVHILNEDGF